jgi:hypothetical protein
MDFLVCGSDMRGWETIRAAASMTGGAPFAIHLGCQTASGHLFSSSVKRCFLTCLGIIALAQTAPGVVVLSGDTNNTAPAGQPYFGNIGVVGGGSGIYLGDGWVISAAHVAGSLPASATFGGVGYATAAGTFHHINNPTGSGLSTLTDIVLFRLGTNPGLPSLSIASGSPTVGDAVTMIGNGRTQESSPTYWHVETFPGAGNDVWTELSPPNPTINAGGFLTTGIKQVRWGENALASVNETIAYGYGDVRSVFTSFDSGELTQEAQGVSGDSGGAVLHHDGTGWVLAGMMVAVGTHENQPGGNTSALIGNITAAADLSFYRNEILAIIPEPSASAMGIMAVLALLSRRRR